MVGIAGDILDRWEAEQVRKYEPNTSKPIYTKKVELRFERDQLLYDIKNIAFVEGDVMLTEDEHDRHQVMDIGEDGNVDRVTRMIDLTIAKCTELLYPYSKTNIEEEETRNDKLEEPAAYTIILLVPDDFSKSTVTYLEKLIHEFVVYNVLADWMSIANLKNPASAKNWRGKMEDLEDDIRSTVNARMHRIRRTQTPF